MKQVRVYECRPEAFVFDCSDGIVPDETRFLEQTPERLTYAISNIAIEPIPDGLAEVEARLQMKLPGDLHSFYRKWGSAMLLLRNRLDMLSMQDILNYIDDSEADPPCALVRFCSICQRNCFALRTRDAGKTWDVVFVDQDRADFEVMDDAERIIAPDFTTWFEELHAKDSTLDMPDYEYRFDYPVNQRVPDEEAIRRFGAAVLQPWA